MHCNYCGRLVDGDGITREQRACYDTNLDQGQVVETSSFVLSATCDCGSVTKKEYYSDYDNSYDFYNLEESKRENVDEESPE